MKSNLNTPFHSGYFLLKVVYLMVIIFSCLGVLAQDTAYLDSLQVYRKKYINNHEVVKGADKNLLRFFPIDKEFRVNAKFERIYEAPWFKMETSGKSTQVYRVYGIAYFTLKDTLLKLPVYQSQQLMNSIDYANHLFLPFTDLTCGQESYDNGRYIDLLAEEVQGGTFIIDFNKAYNPYCAYVTNQYHCPIPPNESHLLIGIRAGEMAPGKSH